MTTERTPLALPRVFVAVQDSRSGCATLLLSDCEADGTAAAGHKRLPADHAGPLQPHVAIAVSRALASHHATFWGSTLIPLWRWLPDMNSASLAHPHCIACVHCACTPLAHAATVPLQPPSSATLNPPSVPRHCLQRCSASVTSSRPACAASWPPCPPQPPAPSCAAWPARPRRCCTAACGRTRRLCPRRCCTTATTTAPSQPAQSRLWTGEMPLRVGGLTISPACSPQAWSRSRGAHPRSCAHGGGC
jgi:hypothetical protein